jgi:hypothetical protein
MSTGDRIRRALDREWAELEERWRVEDAMWEALQRSRAALGPGEEPEARRRELTRLLHECGDRQAAILRRMDEVLADLAAIGASRPELANLSLDPDAAQAE